MTFLCGHEVIRGDGSPGDPFKVFSCTRPTGHVAPRTHLDHDALAKAKEAEDARLERRATWHCPGACTPDLHEAARVLELAQR